MQLATAQKLIEEFGKAKAMLMIDGEDVVDADGTPVELSVVEGKTAPAEEPTPDETMTDAVEDEKRLRRIVAEEVTNAQKSIEAKRPKFDTNEGPKVKTLAPSIKRGGYRVKNFKGTGSSDAEFKAYGFSQWAKWNYTGDQAAAKWLVENGIGQKANFENLNSAGGTLVPDEFMPELIRLVEQFGVARREARVIPMSRETLTVPRRTGGLTAYWESEATSDSASSVTKSSAKFDNVQLIAKKLITLSLVSSELMEDSAIAFGDLLADEIAQTFADKEDDACFNGNGASTYGGIVGVLNHAGASSASTVTAASNNTSFDTLDLTDFHSVTGKLPEYARSGAKWYVSAAGFAASMERLMYAQGGVTRVETEQGPQMTFLGYPVVITQKLNATLTAQTDTNILAFGNLPQGVYFGDRSSMDVKLSEDRYFDTDQIAVKGRERLDIVCHSFDDTSTPGPVIVLRTPGS